MDVAFINENALGHRSYLPRFVGAFKARPELDIRPHPIDVYPLPMTFKLGAYVRMPGLDKFDLDLYETRVRLVTSWHARRKLDALRRRQQIEAVMVNTQSVGLRLSELADAFPLFVSTDTTLAQASRADGWLGRHADQRSFLPLTLAPVRRLEQRLFQQATRLLPMADFVRRSMVGDYGVPAEKVSVLPPSMRLPPRRRRRPTNRRPNILFIGGHFDRKGGPALLRCFQTHFADTCDLHMVTPVDVPTSKSVFVHQSILANTEAWLALWQQADMFVLPSKMDLVPNVLIESLAFEVPVISSDVGAAREMLADGRAGLLLPKVDEETLAAAVEQVLTDPDATRTRVELGRHHAEATFDLDTNAARLAGWLHSTRSGRGGAVV